MDEESRDASIREHKLKLLAAKLREVYKRYKSAQFGQPYHPNKRFDSLDVWKRTASVVYRLNADPEDYIAAQFMYTRGTVFANTLHGPTAQKNYQMLKASANQVGLQDIDKAKYEPGEAMIRVKLDAAKEYLKEQVGIDNFADERAITRVKFCPGQFDPLAVMLLAGWEPRYAELFAEDAKHVLEDNPYLREACRKLNLPLDYIYEYSSY